MDDILDDFRDPVTSEGDEDEKTNDLCLAASSTACRAGCAARVVLRIDCNHGNGEPSRESGCDDSSEKGDDEHMPVVL